MLISTLSSSCFITITLTGDAGGRSARAGEDFRILSGKVSLAGASKIQAISLCYFTLLRLGGECAVMVLPHDLEPSLDAPKGNLA
jgi:hypothetical protein